jgi:hypothetical protein
MLYWLAEPLMCSLYLTGWPQVWLDDGAGLVTLEDRVTVAVKMRKTAHLAARTGL